MGNSEPALWCPCARFAKLLSRESATPRVINALAPLSRLSLRERRRKRDDRLPVRAQKLTVSLRGAAGETQRQLAARLGMTESMISGASNAAIMCRASRRCAASPRPMAGDWRSSFTTTSTSTATARGIRIRTTIATPRTGTRTVTKNERGRRTVRASPRPCPRSRRRVRGCPRGCHRPGLRDERFAGDGKTSRDASRPRLCLLRRALQGALCRRARALPAAQNRRVRTGGTGGPVDLSDASGGAARQARRLPALRHGAGAAGADGGGRPRPRIARE